MIRTEGKVPYLCLIVLLLRTVLNQRKQEEDVKIITAEGKKSHISAGMSTFSSNLCPFAPSCSRRKKLPALIKLFKDVVTHVFCSENFPRFPSIALTVEWVKKVSYFLIAFTPLKKLFTFGLEYRK